MKKALFLYYSQTGQTERAMQMLSKGFGQMADCETFAYTVSEDFNFPWKMTSFFRAFPRCVLGLAPPIKNFPANLEDYDLIFLGGQVWFLSPSLPLWSFLQSDHARALRGKKIITVVTCRNIWYSALKSVIKSINEWGGIFLGQITICEVSPLWASFVTTPRWMLTGNKEPFAFFPAAGIREEDFIKLEVLGRDLAKSWLNSNESTVDQNLLKSNLDRPSLRLMNKIGYPVFKFWARLIMRVAPHSGLSQDIWLILFRINLLVLIVLITPYTKMVEVFLGKKSAAFSN